MTILRCSRPTRKGRIRPLRDSASRISGALESLRDEIRRKPPKQGSRAARRNYYLGDKEVEAADLAGRIQKMRKAERCRWSDFAVLYRSTAIATNWSMNLWSAAFHSPSKGLDVLDTPEVRDVVACLSAAVSPNDAASLVSRGGSAAVWHQPVELRAAMRAGTAGARSARSVLGKACRGAPVLQSVEKEHREVEREGVRADRCGAGVIRNFELPRRPLVAAFLKFVEGWHTKAIARNRQPCRISGVPRLFVQAKGGFSLPRSQDDAVQLLTAHAAKGLEYRHVAIVRGSSTSFPTSYREPLIAFPAELRTSDAGLRIIDDKTLHEEEERRLFYVAMTRAKDTLAIYANQGKSRKDPKPTKFLREFMVRPDTEKFWSTRSAAAVQDALFAEEEQRFAWSNRMWRLAADGSVGELCFTGLSASAIEIYEVSAAFQAGTGVEPAARRVGGAALRSGDAPRAAHLLRRAALSTGDRRRRFAGTVPV
jgi:hypothetical protein